MSDIVEKVNILRTQSEKLNNDDEETKLSKINIHGTYKNLKIFKGIRGKESLEMVN